MTEVRTRRVSAAGWTINMALAGRGHPILFLHGLGISWEWWRPVMEVLSADYATCAVDLPGWGESGPMRAPSSPKEYRDLVAGIIQSLDLGPAVVVGHSLGGYVAVRAAAVGTPLINGLALIAPGGFGQIHNVLLRLLSFPGIGELMMRTGSLGSRAFLNSTVHQPETIPADLIKLTSVTPGARREFLRQLRMGIHLGRTTDAYLIEDPVSLTVPLVLMWGRHDRVLPLDVAYRAQRVLHADPPVIFENSGHLPQIEEPARFDTTIRSFLSRVWPV